VLHVRRRGLTSTCLPSSFSPLAPSFAPFAGEAPPLHRAEVVGSTMECVPMGACRDGDDEGRSQDGFLPSPLVSAKRQQGSDDAVQQQCWDELLDQILCFLPLQVLWRCQGVSKMWHETVGSTVWLWKSTILPRELRPRFTPDAFGFIAKSAQGGVVEIDLRGTSKVDCSAFLLPGADLVQGVQVLRLNREEQARTLPMALEMCYGFPRLRVLDLRWCPAIDDSLVANLCRAQCAASLEDVNLRGCLVSDEGVMCITRCCTALKTLDIGAWPYSRFRGVRSVSDVSLFFIAQCAALRGDSFALESLCIAGRRGTSDEGVEVRERRITSLGAI